MLLRNCFMVAWNEMVVRFVPWVLINFFVVYFRIIDISSIRFSLSGMACKLILCEKFRSRSNSKAGRNLFEPKSFTCFQWSKTFLSHYLRINFFDWNPTTFLILEVKTRLKRHYFRLALIHHSKTVHSTES